MTTLYKLTDKNGQTRNETQWGEGVTHETNGAGELCGPGWLHAYLSPELAVLLNPIHGDFRNPILWEAEGKIGKSDGQLKVGTTKLTTVRKLELIVPTTDQRVTFAIRCALEVFSEPGFVSWAEGWLSGADRSEASAEAAAARAAWTKNPFDLVEIARQVFQ